MIINLSIFIIIAAVASYYALLLLEMSGAFKWTGEKRRLRMFPFYYLFKNDRKNSK